MNLKLKEIAKEPPPVDKTLQLFNEPEWPHELRTWNVTGRSHTKPAFQEYFRLVLKENTHYIIAEEGEG